MELKSSYYGNNPSIANSMVSFLDLLGKALENLPSNPKPECKGFYLSYYNPKKNLMTVVKFGEVPIEKEFKYLNYASKKLTQTLFFGAIRSKGFDNDCPQGSFTIKTEDGTFGAAVSGHDSEIDEAISLIWLVAKKVINERNASARFTRSSKFFFLIKEESQRLQHEFARDNGWIDVISTEMYRLSL